MWKTTLAALLSAAGAAACGGHGQASSDDTVNVYNWAASVGPGTIAGFERETGIKVRYDTFESDEVLEAKLLTGHTQYDVVVPSDVFFEREMRAGVFQQLNEAALPNRVNLDPAILGLLAPHDPGNRYGIPLIWATTGIGYNVDKIRRRLGSAEFESWSLIFDPRNAAKLQDCGIVMLDSPTDVLSSMLLYLGKDPNTRDPVDLNAAADALMRIRPYVRSIRSVGNIETLASGEICAALGWSGVMTQAQNRARELQDGVAIRYVLPREGGIITIDTAGIPADAPHARNAAKWLNYLMRPDIAAGITNAVQFPNGNLASLPFVEDAIRRDPTVYPDAEALKRLHTVVSAPPEIARQITRIWTRFRTGQPAREAG